MPITLDGTSGMTAPQGAVYNGLQLATAQASTSGTSIDFTGIPLWVKRITVIFNGVSTNGTSNYLIQIGSGSFATSGYNSSSSVQGTSTASTGPITNGFVSFNNTASVLFSGSYTLLNISGNIWALSGCLAFINNNFTVVSGGSCTLSGTLDRVRITTVSGDTFDAGSINILYE